MNLIYIYTVFFATALAVVGGVNVDAPPRQTLEAGREGTIVCAAKATADEDIVDRVWRGTDYQDIRNGGRYHIKAEGLHIQDVQPSDAGFYFCEVSVSSDGDHSSGTFFQEHIDVVVV